MILYIISILCNFSCKSFIIINIEMAEGNGEMLDDINVKSEDRGDGERTEDYPKLIEYGLDKKVIIMVLLKQLRMRMLQKIYIDIRCI